MSFLVSGSSSILGIPGGNSKVFEGILELSKANVRLNCEVKSITEVSEKKYSVTYTDPAGEEQVSYSYGLFMLCCLYRHLYMIL